jgi:hypothetical protein
MLATFLRYRLCIRSGDHCAEPSGGNPAADLPARSSRSCQELEQILGRYNACGQRVYFVQEGWYNTVYVSSNHRGRDRHHEYDDDDHKHGKRKHKKRHHKHDDD